MLTLRVKTVRVMVISRRVPSRLLAPLSIINHMNYDCAMMRWRAHRLRGRFISCYRSRCIIHLLIIMRDNVNFIQYTHTGFKDEINAMFWTEKNYKRTLYLWIQRLYVWSLYEIIHRHYFYLNTRNFHYENKPSTFIIVYISNQETKYTGSTTNKFKQIN